MWRVGGPGEAGAARPQKRGLLVLGSDGLHRLLQLVLKTQSGSRAYDQRLGACDAGSEYLQELNGGLGARVGGVGLLGFDDAAQRHLQRTGVSLRDMRCRDVPWRPCVISVWSRTCLASYRGAFLHLALHFRLSASSGDKKYTLSSIKIALPSLKTKLVIIYAGHLF